VNFIRIAALAACSAAAFGAAEHPILTTMGEELQRNFQMLKAKADPAPYFMAYEITDLATHTVGATLGVLNNVDNSHNRYLDVTVRVGTPGLDNYRRARGESIHFTEAAPMPLDDAPAPLKQIMWLETDRVYRAAADRLIRIRTNQQV
jgi:hypothetical protein